MSLYISYRETVQLNSVSVITDVNSYSISHSYCNRFEIVEVSFTFPRETVSQRLEKEFAKPVCLMLYKFPHFPQNIVSWKLCRT